MIPRAPYPLKRHEPADPDEGRDAEWIRQHTPALSGHTVDEVETLWGWWCCWRFSAGWLHPTLDMLSRFVADVEAAPADEKIEMWDYL